MSGRTFLESFKSVVQSKSGESLRRAYSGNKTWTNRMKSLLRETCDTMNESAHLARHWDYYAENYTIDHTFSSGRGCSFGAFKDKTRWYPSCVELLVEVENGNWPEEEIWKLAHWRAPVKALFFCDYKEVARNTNKRRDWLKTKLDSFSEFLRDVNQHHEEDESTRYYIFVTDVPSRPKKDLRWHVYVMKPDGILENRARACFSLSGKAKKAFVKCAFDGHAGDPRQAR